MKDSEVFVAWAKKNRVWNEYKANVLNVGNHDIEDILMYMDSGELAVSSMFQDDNVIQWDDDDVSWKEIDEKWKDEFFKSKRSANDRFR